jgi:glycosyltransferase involved in cell wall biosynthesis
VKLNPLSNHPLVSIITPSFNQASYLEQTLRSVLEQDYSNVEYIVIDGASTDGSVEIIKKYAEGRGGATPPTDGKNYDDRGENTSPLLAYWLSEKDSGQAEAINKGLVHASGEVIAWLNSDDYYLPGAISAAVKVFEENPDVVMVYGDMLAVDENRQTINTLKYKQLTLEDLLCFQIIGQPSVFFRREVYEAISGLDITFHFLLDHHFWIRIAQYGKILHVPQTWAAARYHAEAKNRAKATEFGREAFRILDWAKGQPGLTESILGVERRARASAHRVDARYLLDGGKPASALKAWVRALFIHPPTALARLNIFVSALLHMAGLNILRSAYMQSRARRLKEEK